MLPRRSILEGVIVNKLMMAGAAALLMTTSVAMAQSVASNGGIWDGRDHQPTRAQAVQKEKVAGVEATKSEKTTVGPIDSKLDRAGMGWHVISYRAVHGASVGSNAEPVGC
jgi:hypothetical protein